MNDFDYDSLIEKVKTFAKENVDEKRFNHSVRVAETCAHICSLHGINPKRGYLAGIAHDMCKKFCDEDLIKYASKDNKAISDLELSKPSLLHGRAAAVLLKEKFLFDDEEILEAIANHTFGNAHICALAKILFVSDKIEPGRPQSTDEYRNNLYAMSVDNGARRVIEENLEYLQKKGKIIAQESLDFAEDLKQALLETVEN